MTRTASILHSRSLQSFNFQTHSLQIMSSTVTVGISDRIATITLNRPRTLNAITADGVWTHSYEEQKLNQIQIMMLWPMPWEKSIRTRTFWSQYGKACRVSDSGNLPRLCSSLLFSIQRLENGSARTSVSSEITAFLRKPNNVVHPEERMSGAQALQMLRNHLGVCAKLLKTTSSALPWIAEKPSEIKSLST